MRGEIDAVRLRPTICSRAIPNGSKKVWSISTSSLPFPEKKSIRVFPTCRKSTASSKPTGAQGTHHVPQLQIDRFAVHSSSSHAQGSSRNHQEALRKSFSDPAVFKEYRKVVGEDPNPLTPEGEREGDSRTTRDSEDGRTFRNKLAGPGPLPPALTTRCFKTFKPLNCFAPVQNVLNCLSDF
jgi:hypothetical protein